MYVLDHHISPHMLLHDIVLHPAIQKRHPDSPVPTEFLKDTGITYILADFDVVAVNNQGKLYRRIPEQLKTKLEEAME